MNLIAWEKTDILWRDDEKRDIFAMPWLVFAQNDSWRMTAEIPYWWCVTTQKEGRV